MLIGFIGVPGSGKTTIASSIFTDFKKTEIPTELIVEQARIHIAKKRHDNGISCHEQVYLTNEDQLEIMSKQFTVERYMKYSCTPATAIISDSSVINSYLYLTKEVREALLPKSLPGYLNKYDLLFYCHPVDNFNIAEDSNRVHNEDSIKAIAKDVDGLLKHINSLDATKLFELAGTLEDRVDLATHVILQKKLELVELMPE